MAFFTRVHVFRLLLAAALLVSLLCLRTSAVTIPCEPLPATLSQVGLFDQVYGIVAGDLNGDGFDDVAAVSEASGSFQAFFNNNGFGWSPGPPLTTQLFFPRRISGVDYAGNGVKDMFSASKGGSTANYHVSYFANSGTGTFTLIELNPTNAVLAGGGFIDDVIGADPDGDGDNDVILLVNDDIIYWEQTATNTFSGPTFLFGGAKSLLVGPNRGTVYDMDGDGDEDLVVGNDANSFGELYWIENTGSSPGSWSFASVITPIGSAGAEHGDTNRIRIADLDGDLIRDVIFSEDDHGRLFWFRGLNAAGTSWDAARLVVDYNFDGPEDLDVGDVDGDGDIDIAVSTTSSNIAAWIPNHYDNGAAGLSLDNAFGPVRIISRCDSCTAVRFFDFNADGNLDVLMSSAFIDQLLYARNSPLDILSNTVLDIAAGAPQTMMSFDFDSDGDTDFMTTSTARNAVKWFKNADGLGASFSALTVRGDLSGVTAADGLDLNLDGMVDLVATSSTLRSVVFGLNEPETQFADVTANGWSGIVAASPAIAPLGLRGADVDGDYDIDIVFFTETAVYVARNLYADFGRNGTVAFAPYVLVDTFNDLYEIHIATINDDKHPDIVTVDVGVDEVHVYFGSPTGVYSSGASTTAATSFSTLISAAILDFDSDGDLDIILCSRLTGFWFVINAGNGVFDSSVSGRNQVTTSVPMDYPAGMSVTDYDGDTLLDIVYRGRISPATLGYLKGDGAGDAVVRAVSLGSFEIRLATTMDFNQDGATDGVGEYQDTMGWFGGTTLFKKASQVAPKIIRPDPAVLGSSLAGFNRYYGVASGCSIDTMVLPLGTVLTGCFVKGPLPMYKSIIIDGNGAVINCTGPTVPGGIFDVREGATVTLRNLTIIGASGTRYTEAGASGLRVTGTGSKLILEDVTIQGGQAVPPAGAVLQINRGKGGAVLVESGAELAATRVVFHGNTGSLGGGAVAAVGAAIKLTLADVQFVDNVAGEGGGGGLLVFGNSAGTIDVSLTDVVFRGNTAAAPGSGGGLAVSCVTASTCMVSSSRVTLVDNTATVGGGGLAFLGPRITADLADYSFVGNSAGFGGAFASVHSATVLPTSQVTASSLIGNGVAPSVVSGSVVLRGTTQIANNSASFGSVAMLCSVPLSLPNATVGTHLFVSGNDATIAGGGLFVCLPEGAVAAGDTARIPSTDTVPDVSLSGSTVGSAFSPGAAFSGLYGPVVGSPTHVIHWDGTSTSEGPALALSSGNVLGEGLAVSAFDVFGQSVRDPAMSFQISIVAPATGYILAGGDQAKIVSATSVSFDDISILGNSLEDLTATPEVRVQVATTPSAGLDVPVAGLTATMSACVPGEGRRSLEGRPVECVICPEGTFSDTLSTDPCQACEGESFNLGSGATECTACPPGAYRDLGFLNRTGGDLTLDVPCVCKVGFYSLDGINTPCTGCPIGAVCEGGIEAPYADTGFYPGDDGVTFLECPRRGACSGGKQFKCATGYKAKLCAECDSGYFKLSDQCQKCANTTALVLILMTLMAFVVVWALVYLNTRTSISYRFAAAMIGLNSLQISAIYGRLSLEWGAFADFWFRAVSMFNFNFDLASPECSSSSIDVYMLKYFGTAILPVLFLIPFGVVSAGWFLWIKRKLARAESRATAGQDASSEPLSVDALKDAVIRSYYQLLVLLYLPLTAMTMSYFGCREAEDGTWVLDVAPSRPCYDGAYWAVFPFALVFFFAYCMAIPGFVAWLLWSRSSTMDMLMFQLKYGFLVARFTDSYYYYEVFIMLRKFSVVFMTTFFYSPVTKANAAVVALGASFVHLCVIAPYLAQFHNILAMLCLGSCLAILKGGTLEDDVFRGIVVVTAILVNTAVIFGGNAIDIWRMRKAEKEAEDEFFQPDVVHMSGEVEMSQDASAAASARGEMGRDAELHIFDSANAGAIHYANAGSSEFNSAGDNAFIPPPSGIDSSQFETQPHASSTNFSISTMNGPPQPSHV